MTLGRRLVTRLEGTLRAVSCEIKGKSETESGRRATARHDQTVCKHSTRVHCWCALVMQQCTGATGRRHSTTTSLNVKYVKQLVPTVTKIDFLENYIQISMLYFLTVLFLHGAMIPAWIKYNCYMQSSYLQIYIESMESQSVLLRLRTGDSLQSIEVSVTDYRNDRVKISWRFF